MAWIAVRTDDGEELASFEIQADGWSGWWPDMEKAVPGLVAAVQDALEKDERRQRRR
jgi:hypothetical protein